MAADFERVKAVVGSEQVNAVINRAKLDLLFVFKITWIIERVTGKMTLQYKKI